MAKNSVRAIPMEDLDTATLAGAYLPINPDGLPEACFFIRIVNESDTDLLISYDGVAANDFVFADDKFELNFQANASPSGKVAQLGKGTVVYVNGTGGGATGEVFLVGYYLPV